MKILHSPRSLRPGRTVASALLLLAGAGLCPAALRAQKPAVSARTELELTADSVRAQRKAIVARAMQLSDSQSNKFWPIYDQYQRDITEDNRKLFDAMAGFGNNFANLSDEQAKTALKEYEEREERVLETRHVYVGRFGKVLRPKQVLRLYQLEAKMDAVLRYALAGAVPLVKADSTR
jgi:hypothetical protein